jgi:steroid delta-isomerase
MTHEKTPSPEVLRATLNSYFNAIASVAPAQIAALFAPDGQLEDPIGTETQYGRNGVESYFTRGLASFASHVEITVLAALPSGDRIAAHWAMHVRTKTGQKAQAEGIDVLRVNGKGEIVRAEGYWNAQAFRQSLAAK